MSTAPEEILARLRPTWAEVDLVVFGSNVSEVRRRIPKESKLAVVLKADAYGHGAVELAPVALKNGASMIAVALLEEALELRRSGIDTELLVLGPLNSPQLKLAAEHDVIVGIIGPTQLEEAARANIPLTIHLKLDTGMGRMGLTEPDLAPAAAILKGHSRLKLAAIYTHYANASHAGDPLTEKQRSRFRSMRQTLSSMGVSAPVHHSANSPATLRGLVEPGDYARVGMAIYGGEVFDEGGGRLNPVMRWRTELARIKELPPGSGVGYGHTFTTRRLSRIATLPVGYADGYSRLLSNRGEVLLRGRRAPVVGNISMDLVTVDVTDVADAAVGDEVVLMGTQGGEEVSAEELATKTSTLAYEVFCRISARVPRVYVSSGQRNVKSRFLDRS